MFGYLYSFIPNLHSFHRNYISLDWIEEISVGYHVFSEVNILDNTRNIAGFLYRLLFLFQVFYRSHLLYMVFWILCIIHGSNFWKWFVGPGVIFVLEKLLRSKLIKRARYGKMYIEKVNLLPSGVCIFKANFLQPIEIV